MVFQLELALFQAAQLQLIVVSVQREHIDHRVQITVFDVEFDQTTLDILYISHISQSTHTKSFIRTTNVLQTNCDTVHSLIYGGPAANRMIDIAAHPPFRIQCQPYERL